MNGEVSQKPDMLRAEFARRLGARSKVACDEAGTPFVVSESDPARFMAAFAVAAAGSGPVFLADPSWTDDKRGESARIIESVTGEQSSPGRGWLMIPSGGTGGRLKFARHDQETVGAAVRGFCAHFGMQRVNALGVLPLHHVSGFMAWIRCALTGGEFVPGDWKAIERGVLPALHGGDWVVSLVPTQLQRLLASSAAIAWLRGFRAVFVGGGPAWSSLLDHAAAARLPIAISYGMTETAAMIAALRPADFFAGSRSCGTVLPHGHISLGDEGVIRVGGGSLFRGYFPEWRDAGEYQTEDLGAIDARGELTVLGRRDAVIITGGLKVNPTEVEDALRATGEFADVAVIGVPDSEWGQVVVACFAPRDHAPNLVRATERLAGHQRPKRFLPIADWPRNAQGKVNRAELLARAQAAPRSQFLV